jgi:Lrp/AsnC family leucine-responsive transcriptional regulator
MRTVKVDEIDRRLVELLRQNGRQSYADLGRAVGLSAPAVHDRVAKLETGGVLLGYRAAVAPEAIGLGVTALIGVIQSDAGDHDQVAATLAALPEIESCWFLAGEESFMLEVRVPDIAALEHTIGRVNRLAGVARTRTTVVLSTKWEGRAQPAIWPDAPDRQDASPNRRASRPTPVAKSSSPRA